MNCKHKYRYTVVKPNAKTWIWTPLLVVDYWRNDII